MSPLNRGPLLGPRAPPAGVRSLPLPRFSGRFPPGIPPRMPPLPPMFGPGSHRQRLPPPPRSAGGVSRPNGMPPMFPGGPRARGMAPIVPPMGPRGSGVPCGLPMRPWARRMPPPQMMPPMRPRFTVGNGNAKGKTISNTKKVNKIEELELKKPWMTDEIRNEIQKKNKLYAKAKKNKNTIEWDEFKDARNKVTRLIRDAKNDYFAKHPEQGGQKTDDSKTIESEGVQKTVNSTEQSEQTEHKEETQPSSEQAHLCPLDEEPYDQRDENCVSSDDDASHYCEACDRDFPSENVLNEHKNEHILCGIDGCTFLAHPLLVEKHISMQHRTGLYQRMKNLSTPEDIEKWIADRKKKYPTEANIKSRKAEELEKLQRGEIIKQNSNVQMKTRRSTNSRERRRKPRKRHARETNNNCIQTDEIYRGLRPFPGTKEDTGACSDEQVEQTDLCDKITGNISDEDDVPQASATFKSTNLPVINLPTLPTLVADYESEGDDEGPEEVKVKKIKTEYPQDDKILENAIHEKTSTQIHEEISDVPICTDTNNKSNKNFQNTVTKCKDKQKYETNRIAIDNSNEKVLHRYHNKLLEKLLSRSIQHERNLICQCVKYIIENNFFDSDLK